MGPGARCRAGDWKGMNRALYQFGDRWRESGHVGEKLFAELQPLWKQAHGLLPLRPWKLRRRQAWQRRHAMIDEAAPWVRRLCLRIDAVKSLAAALASRSPVRAAGPQAGAKTLGCLPQAD